MMMMMENKDDNEDHGDGDGDNNYHRSDPNGNYTDRQEDRC